MDYPAINVVMSGIKSDFVREDLECASADILEEMAARGLIDEQGVMASVTEDGQVTFDQDASNLSEDLSVFLDTVAATLANEYEDTTKTEAEDFVAQFIDEMVESGTLPAFPEADDAETEGIFMSAANDMDFMGAMRTWMETE